MSSQQPNAITLDKLHIRNVRDSHVVLEAVRRKILPLRKLRLLSTEGENLESGDVYVWQEVNGDFERWTDGRLWTQSAQKKDYLLYEEQILEMTEEEKNAKAVHRQAKKARVPGVVVPPPFRRNERPLKLDGWKKKEYSVITPEAQKLHLVAYFSEKDFAQLHVIEHYTCLRKIKVPNGVFISNLRKVPCSRTDTYPDESEELEDVYQYSGQGQMHNHPSSSTFSPPPMPLASSVHSPRLSPQPATSSKISLQALISSLDSDGKRPQLPLPSHTGSPEFPSNYTPRFSEDEWALHRFKAVP